LLFTVSRQLPPFPLSIFYFGKKLVYPNLHQRLAASGFLPKLPVLLLSSRGVSLQSHPPLLFLPLSLLALYLTHFLQAESM
jgi:hypothetical protein